MTDPYGQQYPQHNPYSAPQYPGYPTTPKTNGQAVSSMILSLISITGCGCGPLLGLTGAILGHVSLGKVKNEPNASGTGVAMTGIIVGWLVFAVYLGLVAFVVLAATGVLGSEWQQEFQ